jgi:predicted ArsR family transcriptional regulator
VATERCRTLIRTWRVVAILRASGGVTLATLAASLGVTDRTIRRDLDALQAAGIAIYDVTGDDGTRRWRLVKGAPCPICGRAPFTGAELRRELELTVRV